MEAKRFLAMHNVSYLEKDVLLDRESMRELVQRYRVMSVPVLVVGDQHVVGFKPDAYRQLLGL